MNRDMRNILAGIAIALVLVFLMVSCARHAARQTADERSMLKAPLVSGEYIVRANSCSRVDRADFLGGGTAKFGSCCLTNLRFIYEESQWARTLAAIGKAVPTQGDFGMKEILKGAYHVFNAHYVIEAGKNGGLHLVERTGQIIIPLTAIKNMTLSGSRFSSSDPADERDLRWLTITTEDGQPFIFEIYTLPPDKTGVMPGFTSHEWEKEIRRVRSKSFK